MILKQTHKHAINSLKCIKVQMYNN